MSDNNSALKSKAIKATVIAAVCAAILCVVIDVILNLIGGDPAFKVPGIFTIVIDVLIVVSTAASVYRNVLAGKPWYGGKNS